MPRIKPKKLLTKSFSAFNQIVKDLYHPQPPLAAQLKMIGLETLRRELHLNLIPLGTIFSRQGTFTSGSLRLKFRSYLKELQEGPLPPQTKIATSGLVSTASYHPPQLQTPQIHQIETTDLIYNLAHPCLLLQQEFASPSFRASKRNQTMSRFVGFSSASLHFRSCLRGLPRRVYCLRRAQMKNSIRVTRAQAFTSK